MMNQTRKYVEAMDRLDTKLNEEDKVYFNNLREYMNTNIFVKDENSINEQIYQMYLDFMNAKNDGLSAIEFFGDDPKKMANQILVELPKASPRNISKTVGILAIVLWGIRLFYDFMHNLHVTINPVIYLLDLVLILSLIFILFKIINKHVFLDPKLSDINVIDALFVGALLLFYIALYLSMPNLISNRFEVAVPYPLDIALIMGYILVSVFIMWKVKIKEFSDTIIMFFIFGLIGIELRLSMYTAFNMPFWPRLIVGGILLFTLRNRIKERKAKK